MCGGGGLLDVYDNKVQESDPALALGIRPVEDYAQCSTAHESSFGAHLKYGKKAGAKIRGPDR